MSPHDESHTYSSGSGSCLVGASDQFAILSFLLLLNCCISMRDHTLFLDTTFTPLVAAFQYEMTLFSRPTFTLTPLTFSRWSLLRYDTWQGGGIIGAGSCVNNISSCPPSIQSFWVNYGNRMVSILQALPSQHGGYLSNCQVGFLCH